MAPEPVTIDRGFPLELELGGDGRTIIGRAIPFDRPTTVADHDGGAPYTEVWRQGAFRHVVRDPGRTRFVWAHDEGNIGNQLGHAIALREAPEGLEAVIRAYDDTAGAKALDMIRSGAATALSVRAILSPNGSRVLPDGTVERRLVTKLPHIALVPQGAYDEAQVLAVRSSDQFRSAKIAGIRAELDRLRLPSGR